jgi:DMSO/TMAO reductase YedYZ molybdopterin-dependent catalytic subunit
MDTPEGPTEAEAVAENEGMRSPVAESDAASAQAPSAEPAPQPVAGRAPEPEPEPAPPAPAKPHRLAERPEVVESVPRRALDARTRRDFLLFMLGTLAAGIGAWWLLPDRTRARLLPAPGHDALDTIAARVGLTRERRETALNGALTFDDDVAEALYSRDRRVRTYRRGDVTRLRNNYNGRTPGPEYVPGWRLRVTGLAGGATSELAMADLAGKFAFHEQVTRLVCVEGWSAVAWWGGIRFADFLAAYPPAPGARWAAMRSAVNLDGGGNPDPYYVSIDLGTARHPQALLATHLNGQPLAVDHGAPMRLVVPMKLGLKNIKALTDLAYTAEEPRDYWGERGYSKYDGL